MLNSSNTIYYCYLIELKQNFSYDITVQDIFLATRVKLDPEIGCMQFDMCFDRGSLAVNLRYIGIINLSPDQVSLKYFFNCIRHICKCGEKSRQL